MKRLALFCIVAGSTVASGLGQTTIHVTDVIQTSAVKRFGIDLGHVSPSDSRQVTKQLVFLNPGFEGVMYRGVIRCASGTSTTCVDDNPGPGYSNRGGTTSWASNFWNGSRYEFITGLAKGRAGTILKSTAPAGGSGTTFAFTDSSTAPATGDYLVVHKADSGGAADGWTVRSFGGGAVRDEVSDLSPDTPGKRAVKLDAPGTTQSVTAAVSFDTTPALSFIQLNGSFRLRFRAKRAAGASPLAVTLRRMSPAATSFVNASVPLTASWESYDLSFTASEQGDAVGRVELAFTVSRASILLDDVSLEQTNGDPSNTTAFRDAVVRALKSLKPGLLRYSANQNGDTLDNQIAGLFARLRCGYRPDSKAANVGLQYGLHDFLELCELIGAEPWYVVPVPFSADEMKNLIEYLGGPSSTPYGAQRAARGHPIPWTSVFSRIHLEFGNETWNRFFRSATMEEPSAYGARGRDLYTLAKASPFYSPRFDLVLGGQASSSGIGQNTAIHDASDVHDSLSLAPYIGATLDNFANDEEMFGPLFAEPEMLSRSGYMRDIYSMFRSTTRPVSLAVYEVNLSPIGALAPTQEAFDKFTPSLGAGLAVANHMLMMLRDLGIRDQMLASLSEYGYRRLDGKQLLLWGVVRDMGVRDLKRPQYLSMQLANEAVQGDLVRTVHLGDDPTWNQPLLNDVTLENAHHLQSYAFSYGRSKSLVVFNLHRTSSLDVRFTGPNAPLGAVSLKRLTSAAITDNNESSENVATASQTLTDFAPGQMLRLPPFSMSALLWQTEDPSVCITMTKPVYRLGDIVAASEFRLTNPGSAAVPIRLRAWLEVPGVGELVFMDVGADGVQTLPPTLNVDLGTIPLVQVGSSLPGGTWRVRARLTVPSTGLLLCEDVQTFVVDP